MKLCAGCDHEYQEEFKFCPECGRPFGGEGAEELKRKLNQHLLDMKHSASREGSLSGRRLGDMAVGPIYGRNHE